MTMTTTTCSHKAKDRLRSKALSASGFNSCGSLYSANRPEAIERGASLQNVVMSITPPR